MLESLKGRALARHVTEPGDCFEPSVKPLLMGVELATTDASP